MKTQQNLETRFSRVYQPIFYWGVGAFELLLISYTVYLELTTGTGLSLVTTVLPLSIVIAIGWAIVSVLITLAIVGIRNRKKH